MLAVEAFRAAADPQVSPRAADGRRRRPGRRGGLFWNRSSWNLKPSDDLERRHQAGRRRLQPAARRVVRRDGGRQPQHAQEPGLRRRAPRAPIVEYFKLLADADPPARREKRSRWRGLLAGIDVTLGAFPAPREAARPGRPGGREVRPGGAVRVVPALVAVDARCRRSPMPAGARRSSARSPS